jgi:tRNA(fMet)-specific endonuclease VapC
VIVADTDVLIDYLHDVAGAPTDRVELELDRNALATTSVSAYQLWKGAKRRDDRAEVGELLALVRVLPFDARAAQHAGAAYRELAGKGSAIGKADLYIAGVCLAEALPLLTRNRREFERVRGLRLA